MTTKTANGSVSSSLSSKLIDGQSREFFWGCELSADKPCTTWTFEEEDDDQEFLQHTLFLRHAVLGTGVTKDERNIVQVETTTWSGSEIKQPVLSLTAGQIDMCQLDLNFGHEVPVTFRLVEGKGPVFLSAQQMVEFPPEPEFDDETEYTATESELDVSEADEEMETKVKAKKRKATTLTASGKKQRGKLDSDVLEEEDEDDEEDEDEEDEDDEEDESMEADEDDDDEEDEESEEEEEEEEEKPKKSKGKQAKPATKASKKGKVANGTSSKKVAVAKVGKKGAKKGKAK